MAAKSIIAWLAFAIVAPHQGWGEADATSLKRLNEMKHEIPKPTPDCVADAACYGNYLGADLRQKTRAGTSGCVYPYHGQLCFRPTGPIPNAFMWSPGAYGRRDGIQAQEIDRSAIRCVARARLFYVNDALNTQKELYETCMASELSALGY